MVMLGVTTCKHTAVPRPFWLTVGSPGLTTFRFTLRGWLTRPARSPEQPPPVPRQFDWNLNLEFARTLNRPSAQECCRP